MFEFILEYPPHPPCFSVFCFITKWYLKLLTVEIAGAFGVSGRGREFLDSRLNLGPSS
jgi:hypothetical protein